MNDDELNELLARSEEENRIFRELDAKREREALENWRALGKKGKPPPQLMQLEELPDCYKTDEPFIVQDGLEDLVEGRGQRKRNVVSYNDGLDDDTWAMVSRHLLPRFASRLPGLLDASPSASRVRRLPPDHIALCGNSRKTIMQPCTDRRLFLTLYRHWKMARTLKSWPSVHEIRRRGACRTSCCAKTLLVARLYLREETGGEGRRKGRRRRMTMIFCRRDPRGNVGLRVRRRR